MGYLSKLNSKSQLFPCLEMEKSSLLILLVIFENHYNWEGRNCFILFDSLLDFLPYLEFNYSTKSFHTSRDLALLYFSQYSKIHALFKRLEIAPYLVSWRIFLIFILLHDILFYLENIPKTKPWLIT